MNLSTTHQTHLSDATSQLNLDTTTTNFIIVVQSDGSDFSLVTYWS